MPRGAADWQPMTQSESQVREALDHRNGVVWLAKVRHCSLSTSFGAEIAAGIVMNFSIGGVAQSELSTSLCGPPLRPIWPFSPISMSFQSHYAPGQVATGKGPPAVPGSAAALSHQAKFETGLG